MRASDHAVHVDELRAHAWDVGEKAPLDTYVPAVSHVALAMVLPTRGFAHWRILQEWIERNAQERRDTWHNCQMVLRLYDVSCVEFDGLNANSIQDHVLHDTCGSMYLDLPHSGTWQLGEVGFRLADGEFVAAARSNAVAFANGSPSSCGDQTGLLLDEEGNVERIEDIWNQERILAERRAPKLRTPLRIAIFAFPTPDGAAYPGEFVAELARGLVHRGHELHVFMPTSEAVEAGCSLGGVVQHFLPARRGGTPVDQALHFAKEAEQQSDQFGPFDLIHLHEWMTAAGMWPREVPTILSLTSMEKARRGNSSVTDASREIESMEADIAARADCVLVPEWMRDDAAAEWDVQSNRLHAFAMEGRLPNEWEWEIDCGEVKGEIWVGPLDRLIVFVGPLEHAAGADLIVEALPELLNRYGDLRVAFVGSGEQYGHLEHRAGQMGVGHAVRLLGDVEPGPLAQLLRASEAVVLPSRHRVPFDEAVVDLARRAGRPVITTHTGPAHLVEHEVTGVVTYDNPGSIIWAMDRVLGDPIHSQRMGQCGRRVDEASPNWGDVTRRYIELCAARFPHLAERRR